MSGEWSENGAVGRYDCANLLNTSGHSNDKTTEYLSAAHARKASQAVRGAHQGNGRSVSAEIIATLQHFMNAQSVELCQVASGVLLDEVIARYGVKLQIVMPKYGI